MSLVLSNKGKGMQSSSEQPLVGEEHCVTTLITAAKETIILEAVVSSAAILSWNKTSRAQKEQFDWPIPLDVATQVAGKVLH